ncbi:MAG TPA: nuclear transport factor 2 family protein [Gemmatimonadales bacterium]|nr:nuclear transport factor 2 family protein [Gemmatimonadales bacterium]
MASSWQAACRCALGLSLLGPPITLANAQEPTPATVVVDQYRRARARTMEAGATEADVTAASALLADSVLHEHPAAGARLVGRATLGEGMRDFLGSTRDASIRVVRQITAPGVVVAEEQVSFEARRDSGWSRTSRNQVTVYEVRDGHISRMIEYWQPH